MILMRVMMSTVIIIVTLSLIRDNSQSALTYDTSFVSQSRGEEISPASWSDNVPLSFLPSHLSSQTLESRPMLSSDPIELPSSDPIELIVKEGDTLIKLLTNHQVPSHETLAIAQAIEHIYNLRNLQVNKYLWLWIDQQDNESTLSRLILEYDHFHILIVTPDPDAEGGFIVHLKQKVIDTQIVSKEIIIQTTFYQDAMKANVPLAIISNLITIFEHQIDFSRDIRVRDRFKILYKVFTTQDSRPPTFSNIMRAAALLQRRRIIAYQFRLNMKEVGYYSPAGENLRRMMILTPVEGAYISSGYGMRTLFGIRRMHRGIDFAAPIGTKIYAASEGIVTHLRRSSSYGLYLRIQHNQTWATAYAHMSRFAQGLEQGQYVRQGQVIGYIGSTGISTGPHLHFEVLQNNTQVNPLPFLGHTVNHTLSGALLADFQKQVREIDNLASQAVRIAQNADSVP